MRDHVVDNSSGGVKRSVQRAQSVSQSSADPRSIVGLQGTIGNRAVQRLLAAPNAIQRVRWINEDVVIMGNISSQSADIGGEFRVAGNGSVWGDFSVNGQNGTVIANNVPGSAVPAGNASANNAQSAPYNPTEI